MFFRSNKDAEKDKESNFTHIKKVQIRPGKPLDPSMNYLTNVPEISDSAKEYKPMPYTFRAPQLHKKVPVSTLKARSPPFYVLLDHTIAVIWQIFSPKDYPCPLGIAQLQWAEAFLKTIVNCQGERPEDISQCLNEIEYLLIEEYASLAPEISKIDRIHEKTHFFDGMSSTPSRITKIVPFSLNYFELFLKADGEDAIKEKEVTDFSLEHIQGEIKKIKEATQNQGAPPMPKSKALNYLILYKHEKLNDIRDEVRKLRSIENLMKQVDDVHFLGYENKNFEELMTQTI